MTLQEISYTKGEKMSVYPFVYFDGQIQPLANANISIASNTLQYGTNTFCGIRGYFSDGKIRLFRLADHYQRFMNSSKIMGFNYYIDFKDFESLLIELIKKNEIQEDFYIRPFIFSKDQQLGPKPINLNFELAIFFVNVGHYFPQKGMRLMISSWRKFSDMSFSTKAKTGGCYVNSFFATGEALRCGYDEALLSDNEGCIVEASVANIIISYRDKIITPPVGTAMVDGITLRSVIELLKDENYTVCFERIDRSMIYSSNELILTGTAAQIAYADSVDDRVIGNVTEKKDHGPGPLCLMLRKKFADVVKGRNPKYSHWLTVV